MQLTEQAAVVVYGGPWTDDLGWTILRLMSESSHNVIVVCEERDNIKTYVLLLTHVGYTKMKGTNDRLYSLYEKLAGLNTLEMEVDYADASPSVFPIGILRANNCVIVSANATDNNVPSALAECIASMFTATT